MVAIERLRTAPMPNGTFIHISVTTAIVFRQYCIACYSCSFVDSKPFPCVIQQCSRSFSRGVALKRHLNAVHNIRWDDSRLVEAARFKQPM